MTNTDAHGIEIHVGDKVRLHGIKSDTRTVVEITEEGWVKLDGGKATNYPAHCYEAAILTCGNYWWPST